MAIIFQEVRLNRVPDDEKCYVCHARKEETNLVWVAHPNINNPNKLIHFIHKLCLRKFAANQRDIRSIVAHQPNRCFCEQSFDVARLTTFNERIAKWVYQEPGYVGMEIGILLALELALSPHETIIGAGLGKVLHSFRGNQGIWLCLTFVNLYLFKAMNEDQKIDSRDPFKNGFNLSSLISGFLLCFMAIKIMHIMSKRYLLARSETI